LLKNNNHNHNKVDPTLLPYPQIHKFLCRL
jgi:hypothetical protein